MDLSALLYWDSGAKPAGFSSSEADIYQKLGKVTDVFPKVLHKHPVGDNLDTSTQAFCETNKDQPALCWMSHMGEGETG